MMAATKEPRRSYRDTARALVAADTTRPFDELSDALLLMSGLVARLRRHAPEGGAGCADLSALDEASGRAIELTRDLRERLAARSVRGEYASLSSVAREVVGHLQPTLADSVAMTVVCAPGPAIVAADRLELRLLGVAMVLAALDAAGDDASIIVEVRGPPVSDRGSFELRVRWRTSTRDPVFYLGDELRAIASAVSAAIEMRVLPGENEMVARFSSAC
jgi:hypothetical protein